MSAPLVALAGPPGSGKSTAGRRAAELLELEYRSAGELFRAEARRRGMDLALFSRYAEQHEEVDRSLDEAMMELARPGRLLDGRLVGAMCRRRAIPSIYVVVTARPEVRYARLAERDGGTVEEARRTTEAREASERDRYLRYYGIDVAAERPDLTVDSSTITPEAVAERIAGFARSQRPSEAR
ncbi:MAG: AAA family ATPase [Thermoplasmata archaeon]|nr:AAA family ATPase [Thermoplasmata archaeon]